MCPRVGKTIAQKYIDSPALARRSGELENCKDETIA
jgi:hypothetical protein